MAACFFSIQNRDTVVCSKKEERLYREGVSMGKTPIEILAPAGSYASFKAAVNAGADAVYAGGPRFGARAYADNFTEEELIEAIKEAHIYGKKFYLTVNTLLKDQEISELYAYLNPLYKAGLDAVIVQDIGVLEFVREHFPKMDIHASTQMTITGYRGAAFMKQQGISRVVPARELSFSEIRRIKEETGLEVECFVHGALCYCYSGQCLLSSLIGGRSGNRGQCAQPCRLPYTVEGEKKYYLSPKDICTLEYIPDLAGAGIDSFKIEGRMKKPEYVAAVTAMYRKYTDLYMKKGREGYKVDPKDQSALMDLYNRGGFSKGYYRQHNGQNMMSVDRPNHAGVPAVKVKGQKGRQITGILLTDLHAGDVLDISGNYTVGKDQKKGEPFSMLVQKQVHVKPGMVISRVRNEFLISSVHSQYIDNDAKRKIKGHLELREGKPASLTLRCGESVYTVHSAGLVEQAQKQPMDQKRIAVQIEKLGNTPFSFESLDIQMDEMVFLPIKQLNDLRRAAVSGLCETLAGHDFREDSFEKKWEECKSETEAEREEKQGNTPLSFSVLLETKEQLSAVNAFLEETKEGAEIVRVYIESNLFQDNIFAEIDALKEKKVECFLALPHIFREGSEARIRQCLARAAAADLEGVLIRNWEQYALLCQLEFDKKVISDDNLYVFNRFAKSFLKKNGIFEFTAPAELNERELEKLGIKNAELTVYGYRPVMISAQCIMKTRGKCIKKPSCIRMKDRIGKEFLIQTHCDECYNVVYNSAPLYLGNQKDRIEELDPKRLRIRFGAERKEEVKKVLKQVIGSFGEKPSFDYTQEHFKRGVL